MIRGTKLAVLGSLKRLGAFRVAGRSGWRRQRLLILAYHGISLRDEHEWSPGLFMAPELFRSRLEVLKRSGCRVLPLGEAVERLYAGELHDYSVAITFDDGLYDFYARAHPLLRDYGFPATLYLTTFYSHYNRPVFDVMCSYLLWKGRGATLDLQGLTGRQTSLDLSGDRARASACEQLRDFARQNGLSAEEKEHLAASLARRLGVDYDALLAGRVLHLLKPDEVGRVAAEGVDVQLHTHRHRAPLDRQLFRREIEDNRRSIQAMTGVAASHFCYPSGEYDPAHLPWLEELGVISATTCDTGYASRESHRLLLPRLLDSSLLSAVEFEGWLSGAAAMLPRRRARVKLES